MQTARLGVRHLANFLAQGIDLLQVGALHQYLDRRPCRGHRRWSQWLKEQYLQFRYARLGPPFDPRDDVPQSILALVREREVHDKASLVDPVDAVAGEVLTPRR